MTEMREQIEADLIAVAAWLTRMEAEASLRGGAVTVQNPEDLRLVLVNAAHALTAAQAEVERLREVVARLKKRLEIDCLYDGDGNPVPFEGSEGLDGIYCRDETIRGQDESIDNLREQNRRLRLAFHDAIRRPMGVTPDSGVEFYDPKMAEEAEARRAALSRTGESHAE